MSRVLRQGTAATVKVGPFIDDVDFKTLETGLTIAQADTKLSKNGGATAQKNSPTSATHDVGDDGYYSIPLDATDTNTKGGLFLTVDVAGALPQNEEFIVYDQQVYDAFFGSDQLEVDVTQWAGTTTTISDTSALPEVDTKSVSDDVATADSLQANIGNLDASIATVDTVVDAIKVVTDAIPDSGALTAIIASITSILADTGTDGVMVSTATLNSIADTLLKRDWTQVTGEAARSALNALRALRNKVSVPSTTMTVFKEDDATAAWTSTVVTNAAADNITESDPA